MSALKISLSPEEIQTLVPLVEQMNKHEVFEVASVKAILKSWDTSPSESITKWKIALEDSMYTGNDARFRELLALVT